MTELGGCLAHCVPTCLQWIKQCLGSPCHPRAHSPCPLCQSSSELRAVLGGHLNAPPSPHSLACPRETRLNHRAEHWGAVNPNCARPQSSVVERELLPGSTIPTPRLPAIFIPTQLAANARGFEMQHSEMCSFTQVTAGTGGHFFVLWCRAAADGLSCSQAGMTEVCLKR